MCAVHAYTIRRWRYTGQQGRDHERALGIGAETLDQGQLEGFPLNARLVPYLVRHRRPQMSQIGLSGYLTEEGLDLGESRSREQGDRLKGAQESKQVMGI